MKPTGESVGISKLCRSFRTFPSGYCRFRVKIQCIPVDIDTADLFFTAFPIVFVSQPSGKQRLSYDNKTNEKAVINGPAVSGSIGMHWVFTRKRQEPLGYDIIINQTAELRNSYGSGSRFPTPEIISHRSLQAWRVKFWYIMHSNQACGCWEMLAWSCQKGVNAWRRQFVDHSKRCHKLHCLLHGKASSMFSFSWGDTWSKYSKNTEIKGKNMWPTNHCRPWIDVAACTGRCAKFVHSWSFKPPLGYYFFRHSPSLILAG